MNLVFEQIRWSCGGFVLDVSAQLQGQITGIFGPSGAGKTTLLEIAAGLRRPQQGRLSLEGRVLHDTSPARWVAPQKRSISYVPQDVFLFSDTVRRNIAFGLAKEPTDDAIVNAAKNAAIHNEINSLQHGYETMVGERGVTLSGGQKQRISIARALIKNPDILIFDDCLSAVDAKTENQIINNLYSLLGDKTAILITHRIFTVLKFDQVIVVDDGKIIEQGTHEELLQLNGYYAELYQIQTSQETAA